VATLNVTDTTRWLAPAKLNLFLHVVGRRADGYHELQSVFQLVDLYDTVEISVRTDGVIQRDTELPEIPEARDLTVRAARALQQATSTVLGANIRVRKRIPIGGGLGGGSSDAATTLLALNQLWQCNLSRDELAQLGLSLGADVPVFIYGRNAWAEGIGEKLTPIVLPQQWFLIVHPRITVPTAEIFQAPELTRNSPRLTMRDFLQGAGRNDCETVVRQRYPEVADVFQWLGPRVAARLSGTGACVFASFSRAIDAERVAAHVPDNWTAFVVRGLDHGPI
jgi:4-diphosphocytidyl-2-C-methyl-D-erythritol kinase